ncbi:MAG: hypothetical protein NZM43_07880 [Saprospiraceae bacterium]|nr:hypothetical protein [Saprospiraceae bacterium]MDW8484226.1 hypothetical protein [Saprospiraceae bacterium]
MKEGLNGRISLGHEDTPEPTARLFSQTGGKASIDLPLLSKSVLQRISAYAFFTV